MKPILCACLGAATLAGAVVAHPVAMQDSPQDMARQHHRNGGPSIREIERQVIPRMPGAQYLGFDYDPSSDIYTLKFLRNGSVIWIKVEARTARILEKRGS